MTQLKVLGLIGGPISDISALSNLTQIGWIDLENNPLSEAALEDQIPALEAQGVTVYSDYSDD